MQDAAHRRGTDGLEGACDRLDVDAEDMPDGGGGESVVDVVTAGDTEAGGDTFVGDAQHEARANQAFQREILRGDGRRLRGESKRDSPAWKRATKLRGRRIVGVPSSKPSMSIDAGPCR